MRRSLLAVVAAAVLATSCQAPASPAPAPAPSAPRPPVRGDVPPRLALETGVIIVDTPQGERRFKVELAVKDNERQRGLMYRESLADDEGMVFFFERMQPLAFWMKNTFIPLDMIFIDDALRIVGIVESAEPLTTTSRRVPGLSRFVLEVRGGLSAELGIAAGQRVRFEGVPEALWSTSTATPAPLPPQGTP